MQEDKLKAGMEGLSGRARRYTWDRIHRQGICPNCRARDSLLICPEEGLIMKVKCRACNNVFWTSRFRRFRAYPLTRAVGSNGKGRR